MEFWIGVIAGMMLWQTVEWALARTARPQHDE